MTTVSGHEGMIVGETISAEHVDLAQWTLRKARRLDSKHDANIDVAVAEEVPIAMVFNGTSHAVMIATPSDIEDFAVGFCLSEGILASREELLDLEWRRGPGGIEVAMTITQRRFAALAERRRTLAGRTGCGLCGVDSLSQVVREVARVGAGPRIGKAAIWRALGELRDRQPLNARTGAVHAAAYVSRDGSIELVREDIGRHNALDKLLGAMAYRRCDPGSGFVVLTSRCSFEMVQKAASCGVAFLVTISAPTGLALDLAERCGMTIIALARADSMILHTHPHRVLE